MAAGLVSNGGYNVDLGMRSTNDPLLNTPSAKGMLKQSKNLVAASTADGNSLAIVVFERDILKVDLDFGQGLNSFSGHCRCNLHGDILGTAGSIGSSGVFILAQQPPAGTVVEYSKEISHTIQAGAKTTGLDDEDE